MQYAWFGLALLALLLAHGNATRFLEILALAIDRALDLYDDAVTNAERHFDRVEADLDDSLYEPCPQCAGNGVLGEGDLEVPCPRCGGEGVVPHAHHHEEDEDD